MSVSDPVNLSSPAAEQARTHVDRSPLPMVATEGSAHVVRHVNTPFCQLLGRAEESIVGRPFRASVPDLPELQNEDDAVALLDLVYASGSAEFGVDLVRVAGNTNTPRVPCAVWPIMGSDNRPVGLFVQVSATTREAPTRQSDSGSTDELQDVNGRLLIAGLKAQEQADVQGTLRSEAETALTVRDEFISIAAHELRSPVTRIKLSAELARHVLEDATPNVERIDHYLLAILGGTNRLVLLLNDLMDVSRMRSGELLLRMEPIDLGELVRTAALHYMEARGEHHHVTTDLPTAALMVVGDAVRLEQILDNLLSNAVKYSPDGGEIGVWLRQALDGIVLTVSDAGIGLTSGAQERIFEPFGRADNAMQRGLPGMGLGLHICRQIAAAHGGRMWAESGGEGLGMTVGVWLPTALPAI